MKRIVLSFILLVLFCSLAMADPVILPQTGQTSCYDLAGNAINCSDTNQDGDLRPGRGWPSPRFVDNENGTFGDKLTNLVWTKDAYSPDYSTCGPSQSMEWQDALDYVECLNTESYLGISDWVLPNIKQLSSLVNFGSAQNDSWLTALGFTNVQSADYWTSDNFIADPTLAWVVSMANGTSSQADKDVASIPVWPVALLPDLHFTYVDNPGTVGTGQSLTIPYTIRNGGWKGTTQQRINFYFSTDNLISGEDTLLSGVNLTGVGVDQELNYQAYVTIPHVLAGTYYILAKVDADESIQEADEANNVYACQVNVIYGPDYTIEITGNPGTVNTGESLQIPFTVHNIGIGSASSQAVNLYFSEDDDITTADTPLFGTNMSGVGAGGSLNYSFLVTIPFVTSGTYYIGAIVDASEVVAEANEGNNSDYIQVTVEYGPDYTVELLNDHGTVAPGESVQAAYTVHNIGVGTASAQRINVYFSANNEITTGDTLLSSINLSGAPAGGSKSYYPSVTIPSVSNGTYYLGAIVDPDDVVAEANEGNNVTIVLDQIEVSAP